MKALTFRFLKYVAKSALLRLLYTDFIYVNYLLIVHKERMKKWPYV